MQWLLVVAALMGLWSGAHAQCNETNEYTLLCQKLKQIALLSTFGPKVPCPAVQQVATELANQLIAYQQYNLTTIGNLMAEYIEENKDAILAKFMQNSNALSMAAAGADLLSQASNCQKKCNSTTAGVKARYSPCLVKTLQPAYKTLKTKFTDWVKNKYDNATIRCEAYKYARSAATVDLINQGVKFCKPCGCACEWNFMGSALSKYGQVTKYDNQSITVPNKPCN